MNYFKTNDIAKRNDNGRVVNIISVRPIGLRVFYVTEDQLDGHTTIIAHEDLRALESTKHKAVR
jgi:hypothetical protein